MKAQIMSPAEQAKAFNKSVMNSITSQREEAVRNLVAAFHKPELDSEARNDIAQKPAED